MGITRRITIAFIVIIGIIQTGCGTSRSNINSYPRDGMLGTTQANPNLVTSQTYHTYAKDRDMMRTALSRVPGVQDASIIVNGPDAYIGLKLPANIDPDQAQWVQATAQDELDRMMPRYSVHVFIASPKRPAPR